MSDVEATTATVSVNDIAAFSDAQLAQFMQKHRRQDGYFDLPVDDLDRLSMTERMQLAERLQAQERILSLDPAANSRPLDVGQLDERPHQGSDGDDIVSRTQQQMQGRATPPYDEEDELRDQMAEETEAYNDLVSDGGRPIYPISLLEQASRNPQEHRDALWPFWDYPRDSQVSWLVFRRQLKRWRDFRKWQIDNRGLKDEDGGFPAFVEMMKSIYTKDKYEEGLAKIEADPSWLKSAWSDDQRMRRCQRRQRRHQRERGCNGFSDYVDAATRRLAQHGFTRPFQLQEDPKLQDKLTTWIEYLCFEYWWLDRYNDSAKRLKPDHDKRWQELVDQKVLKPHETKKFVRTTAFVIEEIRAENQARQARKAAEKEGYWTYCLTQKDPRCLSIPNSQRIRMLKAATKKLNKSKARLESTKRRIDLTTTFVRATFGYVNTKKDAVRHAVLAQWVLEQVPLVEAELIQAQMAEARPDTKSKKRRRAQDKGKSDTRSPNKRKTDHGELGRLSRSSGTVLADLGGASRSATRTILDKSRGRGPGGRSRQAESRRSFPSVDASPALSQGPRRSARITARLNRPAPTLAATLSRESRPRSRANPRQTT